MSVPTADEDAKLNPDLWHYEDIPMYDPHEVLAYLWDVVGIKLSAGTVKKFWQEARNNGVPWALLEDSNTQRLPLKLFGDDCQYNAQLDKCLAIIISCPLFRPKSARNARWIIAVLKLNKSVGFETLRPILERCVWSLNKAYDIGTPGTNQKFVVTELGGDWKYIREAFSMVTHWNSKNLCHHCRLPRDLFPTFPEELPFRSTAEFIREVLPAQGLTPLILLRNFDVSIITWCQLHTLNLGLLWTSNGGCLALLLELGAFGDLQNCGAKECLRKAYAEFKEWQKSSGVSCSQRRFTLKMLFKAAHGAYFSAKGFNSRVLSMFLNDKIQEVRLRHHEPTDEMILTAHAMRPGMQYK